MCSLVNSTELDPAAHRKSTAKQLLLGLLGSEDSIPKKKTLG